MLTKADREAKRAKSAARKARREANKAFIAATDATLGSLKPARKKRRKKSARRKAIDGLESACRAHFIARNEALNGGMCEIGISCHGAGFGEVWYHGWPQKGGNALKYEIASHFRSCSDCNMGEYGARYRGSNVYVKRHQEILGMDLWNQLDAMHGRKPLATATIRAMTEEICARTAAKNWARTLLSSAGAPCDTAPSCSESGTAQSNTSSTEPTEGQKA